MGSAQLLESLLAHVKKWTCTKDHLKKKRLAREGYMCILDRYELLHLRLNRRVGTVHTAVRGEATQQMSSLLDLTAGNPLQQFLAQF